MAGETGAEHTACILHRSARKPGLAVALCGQASKSMNLGMYHAEHLLARRADFEQAILRRLQAEVGCLFPPINTQCGTDSLCWCCLSGQAGQEEAGR